MCGKNLLWFSLSEYQEKAVDENIKEERWEDVARVVVIPETKLDRDYGRRVEQQETAHKQHSCFRI